jgi:hypothetical protein
MKFLNFNATKTSALFFMLLIFIHCSSPIDKEDLKLLNGYWQIEKVVLNGETKVFPPNLQADYFYLNQDLKGFRKKLIPRLDGKFEKNNSQEQISITFVEGKSFIVYATAFNTWKEEIIELSNSSLIVINEDGRTYYYIPFTLIN